MKFTIVFTVLFSISTSWAVLAKKVEDPKEKRETPVGYGSGLSSQSYQSPLSHGDASAISVGAGYSIGGAKPSYSFGGQGSSASLQIPSEGVSPNGHATYQLAPITLQSGHGGSFAAGDLSQIMNQLSHSLNAGGLSLQPSNAVAEFHQSNDGSQGGQELTQSLPQYTYSVPQLQQYTLQDPLSGAQSYSTGSQGLGSYSTGPVLFSPSSDAQSGAPSLNYGSPSSGQSLGDAGSYSLASSGQALGGISLGSAGNSHGSAGNTFGGAGNSFAGAGNSFGGAGSSFGGAGGSFSGSYKQLGASYAAPSKTTSFKPSAFLGSSVQGESGLGLSALSSGSYSTPSFGSYRGSNGGLSLGSAGLSFGGSSGNFGSGSSKYPAPLYQPSKPESFGSSQLGASSLSSSHLASPPGTTYGFPTASYSANNIHAASSSRPYYVSTKLRQHSSPSSFGEGSSYRGLGSGHGSLSSFSSPKYSFSGSSYAPKDTQGAYSENSYNTIKYSEELKPHSH